MTSVEMTQAHIANAADILLHTSAQFSARAALADGEGDIDYGGLSTQVQDFSDQLSKLGITPGDRVAVIVDKRIEVVAAIFGILLTKAVLVPINPQLKHLQIQHILSDSGARILLGSYRRLPVLQEFSGGRTLVATLSRMAEVTPLSDTQTLPAPQPMAPGFEAGPLATLFYTSGSTGLPKAVATSHANIIAGAQSVSGYLGNTHADVLLAILPLSFDAGFSQLTTGLSVGAKIVLRDYRLPADIARACDTHGVTGITGVPAIWTATLKAKWTETARHNIRYFANTGGHLPHDRIEELVAHFPNAKPYPMYGLTEAFRSSYLHPDDVWRKKGSIGKAIPGATLVVVDEDGKECPPNTPGELVHAGPTVALGYWNNPQQTTQRYRPAPPALTKRAISGLVVYSGDLVRRDEDGFLYYEGRRDGQIKISGNRISFTEIEDQALRHNAVRAAAAGGRKISADRDPELVLFIETDGAEAVAEDVLTELKANLPGFSVPAQVFPRTQLILNTNNKYDVSRMIAEEDNKTAKRLHDGAD